jgi:hypothetical protein
VTIAAGIRYWEDFYDGISSIDTITHSDCENNNERILGVNSLPKITISKNLENFRNSTKTLSSLTTHQLDGEYVSGFALPRESCAVQNKIPLFRRRNDGRRSSVSADGDGTLHPLL